MSTTAVKFAAPEMAELPVGWRWRSLRSLTYDYFSGKRPKGGVSGITQGALSLGGEHLRWDGTLDLTTPRRVPDQFADSMTDSELALEDILIVKDGATTGKTAFVRSLPERAFVNEHVFVVRPNEETLPKYLFYWLWSRSGFNQIMLDFRGAAQGGIGRTFVERVSVPWTEIGTQRRIISRIDELFSELDDGEEELRRARVELATYRMALLKSAFSGELTADWRGTGKSDLAAHFESPGSLANDAACPNDLPSLPLGWAWVSLGELLDGDIQNGLYLPQSAYGRGVPIMRIDDFQAGVARPAEELRLVDASAQAQETYCLRAGDYVVNRVNSLSHLGKSFLVRKQHESALFESNMMRMRPSNKKIDCDFFELYISSYIGRARLCRNSKAAVNQASINQTDVKNTPVPLPPRAEQSQIVRLVTELRVPDVDELDKHLAGKAAILRQSILSKAFRGELVQ